MNYLAQLGWNDGTKQAREGSCPCVTEGGAPARLRFQEIYTIEELLEAFKMERMSKALAGVWKRANAEARGDVLGSHLRSRWQPSLTRTSSSG